MRGYLRMASVGLATVLLASLGVASSVALGKGRPAGPTGSDSTVTTTTASNTSKVLVCHRTHSRKKPFHTISVSPSAVPAHLAHGDTLGACVLLGAAPNSSGPTQGSSPGNRQGHGNGHTK